MAQTEPPKFIIASNRRDDSAGYDYGIVKLNPANRRRDEFVTLGHSTTYAEARAAISRAEAQP